MRKGITLILLLFVFISTLGNAVGINNKNSNNNADSLGIDFSNVKIMPLDPIPVTREDALDRYIVLAPKSIQLYYYTKRYCAEYDIPETIAFNMAKLETGYDGPMDLKYNPERISTGNALGAYQVLLGTGRDMYEGKRQELTRNMLLTDMRLNTKLAMKYLRYLYDRYGSWKIACGFYNTGYPIVNEYARFAVRYYYSN